MTWNKNLEQTLTIIGEQLYTDLFDRSFIQLTSESYNQLQKLCTHPGRNPFSDHERNILKLAKGDPSLDDHFVALQITVKPYRFSKMETVIQGIELVEVESETMIQGTSVKLLKIISSLQKPIIYLI
jgi:hypothetical protein